MGKALENEVPSVDFECELAQQSHNEGLNGDNGDEDDPDRALFLSITGMFSFLSFHLITNWWCVQTMVTSLLVSFDDDYYSDTSLTSGLQKAMMMMIATPLQVCLMR